MTPLDLALLIGACVSLIGVLLCSAHVVELERRVRILEREQRALPYKIERADETGWRA